MSKVLERWLEKNFSGGTVTNYRSRVDHFERFLFGIEDEDYEDYDTYQSYIESDDYQGGTLDDYLAGLDEETFRADFEEFVGYMNEKGFASYTVNQTVRTVKMFFKEQGFSFPDERWSQIRRRKLKPGEKETFDKAGSKQEWRKICRNLNMEGRSLVLFLLSSGCRIGEALQLRIDDVSFDSDPASARIRSDYAKNKRPRTVYFTDEAVEEIEDWLRYRRNLKKKGKSNRCDLDDEELSKGAKSYSDSDRIWPVAKTTAREMLYRALRKSDLDERDPETGNRKIHYHSTRKFFKTNLRGMDEDVVEYLLGHKSGIRGTYRKYEESDIPRRQYKEHSDQLKVWESGADVNLEKLREVEIDMLRTTLKTHGIPEEKIDRVTDSFVRRMSGELKTGGEALGMMKSPSEHLNLADLSEEEYQSLKEEMLKLVQEQQEPRQRLVEQDSLEDYLEAGWRYVDQNGGKVIVEAAPDTEVPKETKGSLEDDIKDLLSRELNATLKETGDPIGPDYVDERQRIAVNVRRVSGENVSEAVKKSAEWLDKYKKKWRRVLAVRTDESLQGAVISSFPEDLDVELFLISEEGKIRRIT